MSLNTESPDIFRQLIPSPAGVSLGPFPNYKSSFISGAAGELFEFADPESPISKRLDDSFRKVVKFGAKITFVASIDDQLVSMEVSHLMYADVLRS